MQTVEFYSYPGIRLSADLYLPDGAADSPASVVCLGWGSVKELMVDWGRELARLGYVVLVPDYRGFGGSGGVRGQCFPNEHMDDIRAALTYLEGHDAVDKQRLGLVGVSYGGAMAVATAGADRRVRALVSIVGYGSGERHLQAVRSTDQWNEFLGRLKADANARVTSGKSEEIDPDDILLRDSEGLDWRRRAEQEYPHMAFTTTLESAQKIVDFVPERSLPFEHDVASLFIHAQEDTMVPPAESESMYQRANQPKDLIVMPGIAHHEVHHGDAFREVIGHVDAWFADHLWLT